MKSDKKRELLKTLAEVWELAPDLRLGQLMANLGFLGENYVDRGLGEIEDDELFAILLRHRGELRARLEGLESIPSAPGVTLSLSGSPISSTVLPTTPAGN